MKIIIVTGKKWKKRYLALRDKVNKQSRHIVVITKIIEGLARINGMAEGILIASKPTVRLDESENDPAKISRSHLFWSNMPHPSSYPIFSLNSAMGNRPYKDCTATEAEKSLTDNPWDTMMLTKKVADLTAELKHAREIADKTRAQYSLLENRYNKLVSMYPTMSMLTQLMISPPRLRYYHSKSDPDTLYFRHPDNLFVKIHTSTTKPVEPVMLTPELMTKSDWVHSFDIPE